LLVAPPQQLHHWQDLGSLLALAAGGAAADVCFAAGAAATVPAAVRLAQQVELQLLGKLVMQIWLPTTWEKKLFVIGPATPCLLAYHKDRLALQQPAEGKQEALNN
jgi:hypothetical protein